MMTIPQTQQEWLDYEELKKNSVKIIKDEDGNEMIIDINYS